MFFVNESFVFCFQEEQHERKPHIINENFTPYIVDIIIKYRLEQLRIGLIVSLRLTVDFSTV